MAWDMSKAETNRPFTPMAIAVWYNTGNKLQLVATDGKAQQIQQFRDNMFNASQAIKAANAERLERTKALAFQRKHGTDGQKRF